MCLRSGLTLLEMVIAVAMLTIIFAVVVPQFALIRNSWDSKQGTAESLQNGRVLMDHINRNLSKAVTITAVSASSDTDGYIEYEDNDGNTMRYDVAADNYVEFGPVGNLSDLAGPVSSLKFTCYDACDLDAPVTDVSIVRVVNVEAAVANSAALGQDKTFTTRVYIRANYQDDDGGWTISKVSGSDLEFDADDGRDPALCQIDSTHFLCAYEGNGEDGWAVVLTVDRSDWTISKGTAYEYDDKKGKEPALAKIDGTHYLCAYRGDGDDGWAVVLTVSTSSWTITKGTPFEFDNKDGRSPSLSQIDATHYLCAYEGDGSDGWAVVLTVNTGGWAVSGGTPFEFDDKDGRTPSLSQIDATHYLCAYQGDGDDGWAVVLTVNTGTWNITKASPFEFDGNKGIYPALSRIDDGHYLCAYQGEGDDGWALALTVNTGTWAISAGTGVEFDVKDGRTPAICQADATHYLCSYEGDADDGWAVVFTVDTSAWNVSLETPYEFDGKKGKSPSLLQLDDTHYLCAYQGDGDDGWAVVLQLGTPLLP